MATNYHWSSQALLPAARLVGSDRTMEKLETTQRAVAILTDPTGSSLFLWSDQFPCGEFTRASHRPWSIRHKPMYHPGLHVKSLEQQPVMYFGITMENSAPPWIENATLNEPKSQVRSWGPYVSLNKEPDTHHHDAQWQRQTACYHQAYHQANNTSPILKRDLVNGFRRTTPINNQLKDLDLMSVHCQADSLLAQPCWLHLHLAPTPNKVLNPMVWRSWPTRTLKLERTCPCRCVFLLL